MQHASLSLSLRLHTGGEIDDTRVERCGECEEICQRWRGEKDNGFIYSQEFVTRI